MKKLLFLALSAGFVFSSCSNDNDDNPSIIGTWRPSQTITVSGKTGNVIDTENASTCYKKSTFDFKSNGSMVATIYDENGAGACSNLGTDTVQYSYNYDKKRITIDGEEQEVISHTNNKIQIVTDYDDEDGDGIDDKIMIVLTK
ncbi:MULTISPECIES: lipocalin family protein [unclassified Chryseobacterium]|uniref:lipocalin family protein n=1 Tax=unclassified Chryseobacterium TaxID=2593645 RepID=UPI00226A2725|nr:MULTISPECIES: lipocalin family protein [unclassified Chryseobacterium]